MLDDYQEEIPVAFVISNREDKIVLVHSLESIKLKCNRFQSCLWFMKEVFDVTSTKCLLCGWHVDRAWRKALMKHCNCLEDQKEI